MNHSSPLAFVQGQISEVIAQIHNPKTGNPRVEVYALVAELCGWMEKARELDRIVQDWTAVK